MQCCQTALGHQHCSFAEEHGELHASFLKQLSCASDVQSFLCICPRL